MNARMISDQIISRARSIGRHPHEGLNMKIQINAALLDITLDVATEVATKALVLAEQYAVVGPQRQARVMRDLRTLWRKVIRNVKAVHDSHPISELHLYAVLFAHSNGSAASFEKMTDALALHRVYLMQSSRADARTRILKVLSSHFTE